MSRLHESKTFRRLLGSPSTELSPSSSRMGHLVAPSWKQNVDIWVIFDWKAEERNLERIRETALY